MKLGLFEKEFFFFKPPPLFFNSLLPCRRLPCGARPLTPTRPARRWRQLRARSGGGPASCPCLTSGIACSGQGSEGVAAVRDR